MPSMPDAAEIFAALPGNWQLARDLGAGGRFSGHARFFHADGQGENSLRYREEGVLSCPDGRQFDGYREYDFICHTTPPAIELLFRDPLSFGNRYVLLEFGAQDGENALAARDIHPCGDDLYHHQMIWLSPNHFETKIKVVGPKKDYLLHSIYRRDPGI